MLKIKKKSRSLRLSLKIACLHSIHLRLKFSKNKSLLYILIILFLLWRHISRGFRHQIACLTNLNCINVMLTYHNNVTLIDFMVSHSDVSVLTG